MKFKVGDIVRFKSAKSLNACYFRHGLENLEIRKILEKDLYSAYESDKSNNWLVQEYELEFQKINNWREEVKK